MIQGNLPLCDDDPPAAAPAAPLEHYDPVGDWKRDVFANHPLPVMLDLAVPLWIWQIKERGGPTQADFDALQSAENTLATSSEYALFSSSKPGESAAAFNAIACSLAVLSFVPGGVRFCGRHWESHREEEP